MVQRPTARILTIHQNLPCFVFFPFISQLQTKETLTFSVLSFTVAEGSTD